LGSLEGRIGDRQVTLEVAILGSREPLDLTHRRYSALLDTGASTCGIGPRVIGDLSMRSHQKKPLSVATELRMVDFYFFRIGLFSHDDNEHANGLPFVFAETQGFSWSEQKSFDVILGIDVLKQCDFAMSRNGRWTLKFG
jgi:hypothetical protein